MFVTRLGRLTIYSSLALALSMLPSIASAAPAVTSLSASPTATMNNYPVVITWGVNADTYGADILVDCPLGVTLKNSDGSAFPCGTHQSLGQTYSGSLPLLFTNVSGSTKQVSITVYPHDSTGADVTSGSMQTSVSAATTPQPIHDVAISSSTITSGGEVTISWNSTDISNSNVRFDCPASVTLSSGGSAVPCGSVAYSTDLSGSGSATVTATNNSDLTQSVTAHILPSVSPGSYDATHEQTATFSVTPAPAVQTPSGSSLVASATTIHSGDSLALSWATQNAASANLEFACNSSITVLAGTTTVPCGVAAFAPALATSGTTTVVVQNSSVLPQLLSVVLLPSDTSGTFYAVGAKTVSITILAAGAAPSSLNAATPSVPPATTTQTSTASPVSQPSPHAPLVVPLFKGTHGAQVTILQTFLAQNSTIYPEGLITGYFGALTEQAVERFQVAHSLAQQGDPWYGFVGPKTRATINALTTP